MTEPYRLGARGSMTRHGGGCAPISADGACGAGSLPSGPGRRPGAPGDHWRWRWRWSVRVALMRRHEDATARRVLAVVP